MSEGYWPETNTLVSRECKYVQPGYSMKDARRLRDKIFRRESTSKDSHFIRIQARRAFLQRHRASMLELLGWPAPSPVLVVDIETYVSRDLLLNGDPPHPVPTEFIRIDALDTWAAQIANSTKGTKPDAPDA